MTEKKTDKKDDVITDASIDDIINRIDDIRSKCPQSVAYKAIKSLEPFLEPLRIRLIDEYLLVVAEIEKDKKPLSRIPKTERQDYLKRLLTPLIKLNRLYPSGGNPYLKHDGTHPFIDEKIWIDKEINIKELHYDKQKYSIDFEYSKPLSYFDPDGKNIIIWDEYREYINKKKKKDAEAKARGIKFIPIAPIHKGRTLLKESYKKWLPTLTKDKIKNNDLLDQILVCFTIKRALNGDEKAIDKLYSLYEDRAIGKAVNMAWKRKLDKNDINEIKQEAKILLRFLISGFRPEDIVNSLSDRNGKYLKIRLQIEKFYFWYYSDYVPKELDKIMKRPPNELDGVEIDYLLNPISLINDYTSWQNTPKRIVKFNSDSFKPGKGTHYITTWLFGTKRNYIQGRFCQLISEKIDYYRKMKKEILYDFSDGKDDEESVRNLKIRQQVNNWTNKHQRQTINDEQIEKANNILCNQGISKRDAEIFTKNHLQGFSKTALAQKYGLSRMQIHRICKTIFLSLKNS